MDKIYELIERAQQGDRQAKEQILKENAGLVWSIVRRFRTRGCDMEDLFQIGSIGLLKCIEKFDMTYDVKFSTYAVPMILGEIKRFLRDDGIIKVSRPVKETAMKIKYETEEFLRKNGREPQISELSEKTGISVDDIIVALESSRDVESIFSTVYQNDGNPVFLIDKLSEDNEEDNFVDIITLKEILCKLEPKERSIIFMRYFEDKTQTEISKILGISQVQVSRIEKRVLENIRKKFYR